MTKVISLARPRAAFSVYPSAPVHATAPAPANPAPASTHRILERQQAIENALCTALFYIRQNERPGNIHAATVKAVRAAAMLKQACAEVQIGGAA